jgi:hypothetical protein
MSLVLHEEVNMKQFTFAILTISIFLIGVASGQEKKDPTKMVVVIPQQIAAPLVAYQPDCPLRIEDIKLFKFVKGGGGFQSFNVRNTGTKAIRSYTIGTWNSVGTGWQVERPVPNNLLPGDVSIPDGDEVAMVVFVVVRVEFADGSTYDGEPLYKALKGHLDKVSL